MIPIAYLRDWSAHVPWPDLRQVEQDLIISRALCDLFACEPLQGKIAFRGGTAIHKLLFQRPLIQLGLEGDRVMACFHHYLGLEDRQLSRAHAEERMLKKLNQSLIEDIAPLLPAGASFTESDAIVAFGRVWKERITRIPGEPWKSSRAVIEAIRNERIPDLLRDHP